MAQKTVSLKSKHLRWVVFKDCTKHDQITWTLVATGFMKREGGKTLLNLYPSGKNQFPSLHASLILSFFLLDWREKEIGALAQTSDKQVPLGLKRGIKHPIIGTRTHNFEWLGTRMEHDVTHNQAWDL